MEELLMQLMKKLLTKIIVGLTFVSLACFYSGGVMAMDSEINMDMNGDEHCAHCYSQESFACDYDEAVIPPQSSDDDFYCPVSNDFSFRPDFLYEKGLSYHSFIERPPDRIRFIPNPFIVSNVVLLI